MRYKKDILNSINNTYVRYGFNFDDNTYMINDIGTISTTMNNEFGSITNDVITGNLTLSQPSNTSLIVDGLRYVRMFTSIQIEKTNGETISVRYLNNNGERMSYTYYDCLSLSNSTRFVTETIELNEINRVIL